jgi:uncharacterized phage protein gp47/JayE
MTSSSSVPSIAFTQTGVVLPAESDILAGVQSDMNAAFGGKLNPALETPQGQLASSMAAIIADKNAQIAEVANQVDPDTADGRWQDAIARIYFIDRLPALATVVAVLCTGLAGTVIPVGALVVASDGNTYSCTGGGTIPAGGSITLQFACTQTGPIVCSAGMITSIYRAIPGWDSATNTAAGTVGTNVESRADFEYRRRQSVALNGVNSLQSIYANVFAVSGVSDVYVTENTTNSAVTKGSITLAPHSIYVAAVGGLDADVATAIWKKKATGADYNGNTTVTVQDTSSGSVPYPSYAVKFQRPAAQPILFAVQIANLAGLPSDIVTQVQNAIVSAFSGGDGGPRARIGSTIYASRFYGPISAIAPGIVEILSLLIGTSSANAASVAVDIGSVPTVSASNISVTLV